LAQTLVTNTNKLAAILDLLDCATEHLPFLNIIRIFVGMVY